MMHEVKLMRVYVGYTQSTAVQVTAKRAIYCFTIADFLGYRIQRAVNWSLIDKGPANNWLQSEIRKNATPKYRYRPMQPIVHAFS